MAINLDSQNKLFLDIGNLLKREIEGYVIGGSAMMYHGVKRETKDVDIVFLNERDQKEVVNVLKELGFKERLIRLVYVKRLEHLKKQSPIMLQKDDARIYLFNKKIICFYLTENIEKRVRNVIEFNNLIVKIVAPEDIILLKCATERAGDRADASEIIKNSKINWGILINESIEQAKLGENIFPLFLHDFLLELKEDFKVNIPNEVIEKLADISEKELIKRNKKIKN